MKINPSSIVRDHLGTLRDDRTGRTSAADLLIFYGLPAATLGVGLLTCFQVGKDAYNLSVTFFGIFIALLLNIQVAIFAILQRKRDEPSDERLKAIHQRNLHERRALLAELNANISYLVLFCCVALVAFLILFVLDPKGRWPAALSLLLYSHFLLTLIMVVKRSHALFQREYTDAV